MGARTLAIAHSNVMHRVRMQHLPQCIATKTVNVVHDATRRKRALKVFTDLVAEDRGLVEESVEQAMVWLGNMQRVSCTKAKAIACRDTLVPNRCPCGRTTGAAQLW